MITVLPVVPAALIERWDLVEAMLEKAVTVNLGRYWPIDILAMCIQGQMQAWMVKDDDDLLAVAITRVDVYPRRRCFAVFCLSGRRMDDWFAEAEKVFTDTARRLGCDHFETIGRRGWERVLGLEPKGVILVKEITNDGGANV